MPGCQVPGVAVEVSAGLPGSGVSGRGHCRVGAFGLSGLLELAIFFITISHCAWRHVISLSKATKKRSKENAFRTRAHKLTQRAVSTFLAPQKHGARQSHGCVNPSFSRILTRTRFAPYALGQARLSRKPARPHALLGLHRSGDCLICAASFVGTVSPIVRPCFEAGWRRGSICVQIRWVVCPRIARGEPWAGSVTGGEACGYPCSEKEGFKHPPFWRAPYFWGAKNVETAR